ncbi:MFS transporter [Streptomyces endophytica]|uniref:MFS transporter n=1 Tax=Streptomyces endophytica TaxID=2991496 RepID=A0ABY6PCJ6_9ACTN|nr:MFS transporter [Streptomyces endophytica]UZJ30957.1 MFS transporter [Streptomyces endophytica]
MPVHQRPRRPDRRARHDVRATGPPPPRRRPARHPGRIAQRRGLRRRGLCLRRSRTARLGFPAGAGPMAAGVLLLAGFAVVEVRASRPLLPMRLLLHRARAGAFLSITLMFVAMFGFYLFMSYYTQTVLGYSPVQAGLTLIINALAALLGSTFIAGKLHGRVVPAALILAGLIAAAVGMLILTRLTPQSTDVLPLHLVPALVLTGIGLGCVIPPTAGLATAGVTGHDIGAASAAYNASQQLGAALGTALLNTIAAGTTATYLASARHATSTAASVHGYTTALTVGFGILLVAACVTAPLIVTRTARGTRRRGPDERS